MDGCREVLGTAVGDSESYEFWREFFIGLKARGLSGVQLITSDAHAGLKTVPNPAAFLRLATAVVIEAHDEWQVTRRYLSEVSMLELKKVIAAKQHAARSTGPIPPKHLAFTMTR